MTNNSHKTILYICNKGGHYSQMLRLKSVMSKFNSYIVSDKKEAYKDWEGYGSSIYIDAYNVKKHRLFHFFKNLWQCFRLCIKYKPEYIVTTGAGLAIPMFIAGRILGKRLIFIESRARVYTKSASGKLLGKLANKVIVQLPEMLEVYGEKASYYVTLV